jgi:hypothetical protein
MLTLSAAQSLRSAAATIRIQAESACCKLAAAVAAASSDQRPVRRVH